MLNAKCQMPNDLLMGPWLAFFVWKIEVNLLLYILGSICFEDSFPRVVNPYNNTLLV